ncbi:hypothetical protein HAX54_001770 [Datura stramonium]|uniref:Uncharacterized protein n=1 Tax=Datura stramonium TaxID=4076 RepID=A0ABS8T540_DATST|nr:hypothetical protein [Datura stramonium]
MNVPICDRGERWLDIGAASPAWIGRKGFAFRSLFEAGLDERGQVRDSSFFRLERLTPLSLKGRSRRSESKGQRVIFEGYYASLFIVECKVDSIYKRRSTGDTQIALTDTREGEVVFLSSRHTVRLKALRRRGGAVIYVITVFVGRCSGRALSFLCPLVLPNKTDFYQPAKGCQAGPGTKNESISVHRKLLAGGRSTVRAQCSGVGSDSTKLYDQRDQSARRAGYSSSGETKSSLLLTEPSVRGPSSTCYEAPVFGGSPLLDLERRTSGQGKAQCAWCKWLSFS